MTRDGNYRSKKLAPPLSRQTSNFRDSSFKLHVPFRNPRFGLMREKEREKKKERRKERKNPVTRC